MKNLPKIYYKTIPHGKQRYETPGDYYQKNKVWFFRVSKLKADYEFLILMHELIEWYLTQKRGISEKSINKFDILFENERTEGLHTEYDEAGFDIRAPYRKEHTFATKIEKEIAKEIDVDMDEYDSSVINLLKNGK